DRTIFAVSFRPASFRAASMRVEPGAARLRAIATPMPREAPVITTTRSMRRPPFDLSIPPEQGKRDPPQRFCRCSKGRDGRQRRLDIFLCGPFREVQAVNTGIGGLASFIIFADWLS